MAGAGLLPLWLLLLSLAAPLASPSASAGDQRRLPMLPPARTASTAAPAPAPAPASVPAPAPAPDDPPRELLPKPPMDLPRLFSAGHDTLRFAEEDTEWTPIPVSTTQTNSSNSCNAILNLSNLKTSSKYLVKAMPVLTEHKVNAKNTKNWYQRLPTKPYTETVSAQVSAVEDLQVHSAGSRWVVLSWLPPTSSCLTELEYEVRVKPAMLAGNFPFKHKGSLWSNAPWTVKKPAMPCISWPDRHCLLVQEDSKMNRLDPDKEYLIDVRVKRIEGGKTSEERKIEANTTDFGGVLNSAHVRVALAAHARAHARPLYETSFNVSSVNRTYAHVVSAGLEAGRRYDVFVRFGTRAGKAGAEAHVAVWLPPSREQSPRDVCEALGYEVPSSLTGQGGGGGGGGALLWGLALLLMGLVAVGALFVGRRWGSRKRWSISSQDDSKSSGVGSGCSSVGDEASLCGPAAPHAPLSQPPAAARAVWELEYAEVTPPATGRARSAAPRHDYEELLGRSDDQVGAAQTLQFPGRRFRA
ncbi:Protein of unknown function, partial [Gryllus bimaculatus]